MFVGSRGYPGIFALPVDETIFEPFGKYLRGRGVRIQMESMLLGVESAGGRVSGAIVQDLRSGSRRRVEADWYVMAVPQDRLPGVLTPELISLDPLLWANSLRRLGEQWLGGGQLFIKKNARLAAPLIAATLAPWQTIAVDYAALRPGFSDRYGDGSIDQWISLDLQTWDTVGSNGLTAKQCTPGQLVNELITELGYSNDAWNRLDRRDIARYQPSPVLKYSASGGPRNDEPLWGPIAGSWSSQPDAATKIENLLVGASFAKNTTAIDSMDSGCEAGRRAANAIFDRSGYTGDRAFVDSMVIAGPGLREVWEDDDRRYAAGLPNRFDVIRPYRR